METKKVEVAKKYPRSRQARWDYDNMRTVSAKMRYNTVSKWHRMCTKYGISSNAAIKAYIIRCLSAGKFL